MQAAAAFSLAAALTFAPASVLTAALPFAAPADVYAAVVEGSHAVDPAALSGRESYGPGTVGAFREQKTDDVSGSGTVGGSQAQSSYSSADLLTLPCPAGLEPDLWEAAKVSVRLYDEAVRTNLAEVNAVRKAAGVPEVVPDQELCMIAAYRAAFTFSYKLKTWEFQFIPDFFLDRGYMSDAMNTNRFLINARVSYKFMKNKASLMLYAQDLLNRSTNNFSDVTATSRTEGGSSFLHHYVSLTFNYKFDAKKK